MNIEAHFLDERELIGLIHLIRNHATPRPKEGWKDEECASSAVYLEKVDSPLAELIYRRLVQRIGANPSCCEGFSGIWYKPGEGYRGHHDAFIGEGPYDNWHHRSAGQRVMSAIIYLNTVIHGGATIFPQYGITIAPRAGTLVWWQNLDPAGAPDPRMIHLAEAPLATDKYIIQVWVRERPLP